MCQFLVPFIKMKHVLYLLKNSVKIVDSKIRRFLTLFEQDIQILCCAANTNKVNTLTDLVSKLTT